MNNISLGQSTEILKQLDLKRDLEGCVCVAGNAPDFWDQKQNNTKVQQ
jgi:hypothetical protein